MRVNLLPISHRNRRAGKLRLRFWMKAAGAYTALLIGACAVLHSQWHQPSMSYGSELIQTASHLEELSRSATASQRDLSALQIKLSALADVAKRPDWTVLLSFIERSLPPEVVIADCVIDADPKRTIAPQAGSSNATPEAPACTLTLRGFARSHTAISRFVARLQWEGILEDVKLTHSGRETYLNTVAIGFEVECAISAKRKAQP